MTLSDQALDALLKRLHLANTRRAWRELTRRAEQEEWSYRDFLALLVSEEIAHRQQTRLVRLVRRARFPFLKTIDDFNFIHQSTVRLSLLGSALAPEFVTEGRCLILSGKPGRGKTHLAVAIAYRAIQNGFDALFVTAAELIDDLSAAFRSGRLADALATYLHPGVLIVDEVGYLTYGTDAANMLFHVVNDRHRKQRPMIFTTNKALPSWGRVLHDEDLAHAILDRILERGRVLTLDGPSMRTKHLGLDDPTSPEAADQPARISGIKAPEFPEPTGADAYALTRHIFENVVVGTWLLRPDDEVRRHERIDTYVAHFEAFSVRLETVEREFTAKMGDKIPEGEYADVRSREIASEVFQEKWMYWSWFTDLTGKQVQVKLKQMAEEVGLGSMYDTEYFRMCALVHSAPASIFEDPVSLSIQRNYFSVSPEPFFDVVWASKGVAMSNAYIMCLLTEVDIRYKFGLQNELQDLNLKLLLATEGVEQSDATHE